MAPAMSPCGRSRRLSLTAPCLLDLGGLLVLGGWFDSAHIIVERGERTTRQGSRRCPEDDQARRDDGDAGSDSLRECALCQRADRIREVERHHIDRKYARP